MNRRAMRVIDVWADVWTLIFLVFGLALSLIVGSLVVNYLVIFISGFSVGRLYHIRKHRLGFPFFLIIFGYLAGYIIGTVMRQMGNVFILLILFFVGCWFGDYVLKKKYCK